jgi:ABC-type Fe3+/spermidine/putrescine transport system ATPase subunit
MIEVKIENLMKKYGNTTALAGVSLNLKPGTMTAVLGPSGCGKTTMLRAMGGFLKPDGGRICFGGRDVTNLPPQDRGAALVFQNYALWPHMSVYDNIAYGLRIKKVSKEDIEKRVKNIVNLVGLDEEMLQKDRKPTQLSGGQQQRVALARALVVEPSVFLLDEPLSNLDAKVRSKLRVYIREIQQKVGITALYVTHDQEEALSIADTIVIMDKGKIMQIGTPEEIYSKPQNLFVAEFIGDSTILKGLVKSKEEVELEGNIISGIEVKADTTQPAKPGDEVKIILRAADLRIYAQDADCSSMENVLCLSAYVENSMFIGSKYKHIIRFREQTIFADWEVDYNKQKIKLVIPKDKIRIFK